MTLERGSEPETVELSQAEYERLTSDAGAAERTLAELEQLRPMALRESIRSAGFDPDSSAGRVLAELAAKTPGLESAAALRAKASELGLGGGEPPAPADDNPGPYDFAATWPADDVAHRVHARNAAMRDLAAGIEADAERRRAEREERNKILTEYGRQIVSEGTGGWTAEQAEALTDAAESGDYMAQISRAREAGDYPLASALQLQYERSQAGKAGAR